GMCVGVLVSYASSYEDKVLPGVSIGEVEIGGMERAALATFLQEMKDKLVDAGITLTFEDETGPRTVWIESSIVSEDFVIELIHTDVEKEVDTLVSYHKDGNMLVRGWSALLVRLTNPRLELGSVTLDQERLKQIVANHLEPFTEEPRDAGVIITDLS